MSADTNGPDTGTLDPRSLFGTNDIGCAAYLVYLGHELLHVEWEGTTALLYFEPSADLMIGVNDWGRHDALVEGRSFTRTHRSVRHRLYQARPSPSLAPAAP